MHQSRNILELITTTTYFYTLLLLHIADSPLRASRLTLNCLSLGQPIEPREPISFCDHSSAVCDPAKWLCKGRVHLRPLFHHCQSRFLLPSYSDFLKVLDPFASWFCPLCLSMSSILLIIHLRQCANEDCSHRIYEEEDVFTAVDARTESLQNLRELGPPDLVYLVKQSKTNPARQVYLHHAGDPTKSETNRMYSCRPVSITTLQVSMHRRLPVSPHTSTHSHTRPSISKIRWSQGCTGQ